MLIIPISKTLQILLHSSAKRPGKYSTLLSRCRENNSVCLNQQKQQYLLMMKTKSLESLFGDPSYAWQLLESEMKIEMMEVPEGSDISNLLQLYMRGVEVMNSLVDRRESYFRNKVTALMAKNTVIKTFNKPKAEPQVVAKQAENSPVQKIEKKQGKKSKSSKTEGLISSSCLQEKKKELQLRLAYASEDHNPEGIKQLLAKNQQIEIKITKKIETILKSHEESLAQRINRRKLKTATIRSRTDDQTETLQAIESNTSNDASSPLKMTSFNAIPEMIQESPLKNSQRKMYKSADCKEVKTRERKKTVDLLDLIRV